MKKSRIDVEYDVNSIEEDVRRKYDLPDGWYGDCYGSLIEDRFGNNLMTDMEMTATEEEYQEYLNEIKENFERAASSWKEEGGERKGKKITKIKKIQER